MSVPPRVRATGKPGAGRMGIRWRGRDVLVDEASFESMVRAGFIPEDAWIISPSYTSGHAIQAVDLEVYHLWKPEPVAPEPPDRASLVHEIFLRSRGSVTVILLIANLAVAGGLGILWRTGYPYELRAWARAQKLALDGPWDVVGLMPTTFIHADAEHLFGNLLYLFIFGAIVEYCLGWWRMLIIYFVAGFAGAEASLLLLDNPMLSVGASGAIFGLIGATFAYVLRHLRDFNERLRWRARRIAVPLLLAVIFYSLSSGNFWAHSGGLIAGALTALALDRPLPAPEPASANGPPSLSDTLSGGRPGE